MNKLGTIFPDQRKTVPPGDSKNYAGGVSYDRGLEEQTLQGLMTGCFEDTFYASQKTLVDTAVDQFKRMALRDPELFAKMIVYARNKGFMRIAPITALVVLSTCDVKNFSKIFPSVIQTPGDLQDFIQIVRSKAIRAGFGRGLKTVVGRWLNSMSEYHAIKYGSQGAAFSLRDILRLARPKPTSERTTVLFNYLCQGLTEENAAGIKTYLPQVRCIELLKEEKNLKAQQALIAEGRLPYEVVVGALKPDVNLWMALMEQMPYFALLRHLNTLAKADVFDQRNAVDYVVSRLTDKKQIQGSKVLPFRFFSAYHQMDSGVPQAVREALVTALESSFDNVPTLPGRTAVGCDTSGSMASMGVSPKSKVRFIDIAAILTAAMLKKTEEALILPFDTSLHMLRQSKHDSLMTIADGLAQLGGGGTNVGIPIEYLLKNKIVVDTFIGITDSESWVGQGFLPAWREYKQKVAPNAKAFMLQLAPYNHAVAPQNERDVWFFYGWSENVLQFIALTAAGEMTQLDAVRTTPLN